MEERRSILPIPIYVLSDTGGDCNLQSIVGSNCQPGSTLYY